MVAALKFLRPSGVENSFTGQSLPACASLTRSARRVRRNAAFIGDERDEGRAITNRVWFLGLR
jgi:hypothetical protein